MKMKIKMKLLSDIVFGSGMSVPGGENIAVLCDEYGFPYYKGSTFKGVFREEMARYLGWSMGSPEKVEKKLHSLFGQSGDDGSGNFEKLVFSEFVLSENVREAVLKEIGTENPELVTDCLSHLRTFTRLSGEGMADKGSLRNCRCVNKNLVSYSEVSCADEDEKLIRDVLSMVKWIGSMRNRGFGKVQISVV